MRCVYRPVPPQQTTNNNNKNMRTRKWAKATMQMVWFAKFKGRSKRISSETRIKKGRKKHTLKKERTEIANFNHGFISIVFIDSCSNFVSIKTAVNFVFWTSFDLFSHFMIIFIHFIEFLAAKNMTDFWVEIVLFIIRHI